jgi:hypothetical protein
MQDFCAAKRREFGRRQPRRQRKSRPIVRNLSTQNSVECLGMAAVQSCIMTCGFPKEHDCVVLLQDLPEENLKAGDIGTVVHIHKGGAGYEVEFMTLAGETLCVASLMAGQVRSVTRHDVAHVRERLAV